MNSLKQAVNRLLRVRPAREKSITVTEPMTFRGNVMKNRIWYRGEPWELEQFFTQAASGPPERSRFWATAPAGRVRKLHSGLVGTVVDRYRDMVTADFNGLSFGETGPDHPLADRWEAIARDSGFRELLGRAVAGALACGDGAFKLTAAPGDVRPRLSFYEADRVEPRYENGRLTELRFLTPVGEPDRELRLEETYGRGYIRCRLMDGAGRERPLSDTPETAALRDVEFPGDFILGTPVILLGGGRWPGRGKALFEGKTDALDALDEVLSQWMDGVRMGRVKRYIPEDMVPRDPDTGRVLPPDPFENDYIAVGSSRAEGAADRIDVSQPQIAWEAYAQTYAAFLELALQGVMSPATLGADLKRTDNAEAQREKENITLHVRGRIVDALCDILPELAGTALMAEDLLCGRTPGRYRAAARFGEYGRPDFGTAVDTVARARAGGIMSIEQAVEELYGDAWTPAEKAAEAERLRREQDLAPGKEIE